jgi:hypothetical protein
VDGVGLGPLLSGWQDDKAVAAYKERCVLNAVHFSPHTQQWMPTADDNVDNLFWPAKEIGLDKVEIATLTG